MFHRYLFFLSLLWTTLSLGAKQAPIHPIDLRPETEQALKQLDKAIATKATVRQAREAQMDVMKRKVSRTSGQERINILKQLFRYYTHVQTDSAWHYLQRMRHLPEAQTDVHLQSYLTIAEAEVFAVKGLFLDAERTLTHCKGQHATPELARYYFHTARSLYGWMTKYTSVPEIALRWERLTQRYRDSIILAETPGVGRDIVRADDALTKGNYSLAQHLLEDMVDTAEPSELVYVYNLFAQMYRQKGMKDREIYFLALTAHTDFERGITEYEALNRLAQVMYEQKDIQRAYDYLRCSLEDAAYCGTSLRTMEASSMFSIIDHAYRAHDKEQRHVQKGFTIIVGLLSIVLAAALFFLRNRVKQLHKARQHLSEAMVLLQETNTQLEESNSALRLTGLMKDEYITRYLERCRAYLDEMQEYRFSISKMLKAKDYTTLANRLKVDSQMAEEQASFYADFDKAFLHLFPHFIESFNALLKPEAQISRKRSGALTTELRIFALIRLGVQDTNKIAHFLNSSLATVYNYRSRIRNQSFVGKDLFEAEVMKI